MFAGWLWRSEAPVHPGIHASCPANWCPLPGIAERWGMLGGKWQPGAAAAAEQQVVQQKRLDIWAFSILLTVTYNRVLIK